MNPGYQEEKFVRNYLRFLASHNGRLQQKFLYQTLRPLLPPNPQAAVLDAACGSGWLLALLRPDYQKLAGFDASPALLALAKKIAPNARLEIADVMQPLPFATDSFDCVVLNMAAPDIENLNSAFQNVARTLKPLGRLIITVPNPDLTFPKAVWKRGVLGWLLRQKPKLKISPQVWPSGQKIQREFGRIKIPSFYYTLADYARAANGAGLEQKSLIEIKSGTDSPDFDLAYQLFRYPLLLALIFEKPLK